MPKTPLVQPKPLSLNEKWFVGIVLLGSIVLNIVVDILFGTPINAHALWPHLPGWWMLVYPLVTFVCVHESTSAVTLYLHRCQTHRSIRFHPAVEFFERTKLWLLTGMVTKQWVAVHRKHHAFVDAEGDPHSPALFGIWRIVLLGTKYYHHEAHNQATLDQYGRGTPDDRIERWLFSPLSLLGPVVTLVLNLWFFGTWGLSMWLVEMAWIPLFAAGVINGLGHWWGVRNFNTPDNSRNLPGKIWSLVTCGESLHNNHHHKQNSPNFAMLAGEIDPGYWHFCFWRSLGLAYARET